MWQTIWKLFRPKLNDPRIVPKLVELLQLLLDDDEADPVSQTAPEGAPGPSRPQAASQPAASRPR